MVTTTDTTEIITQPKLQSTAQPSFKRWFKHFCYLPASKRYFTRHDQSAIASAVRQAEHGHVGEIQVVIEGHIPCGQAYYSNTRMRAQQLFAELGVWDTESNSGVLLYLNLCEQAVEIVIDRGIENATSQTQWQQICNHMIQQLKQRQYRQGVVEGVTKIGTLLQQYYAGQKPDLENEITDYPIILN